MSSNLTPAWLFNHSITVEYFLSEYDGSLATAVPASVTVNGFFEEVARVVRTAEGVEKTADATAFLPGTTSIGSNDQIIYNSKRYRIVNIEKPRFGASATPAYTAVRVIAGGV